MLVVKKIGVCVTHISRSVTARLMMNMLAGVRRLRLLQSKHHHYCPDNSQVCEVDAKTKNGSDDLAAI